jgi:ATP:cob(I)alamin adenosyltransferase
MKITTKKGDRGKTALFDNKMIDKDDITMEVNGTIDELDVQIGEAKWYLKQKTQKSILNDIQIVLKRVMTEIAFTSQKYIDSVNKTDIDEIEKHISFFEQDLHLTELVIPGGSINSVVLDKSRVICRRAERLIVSLNKREKINHNILVYFNRLSDLLFLMARREDI